MSTTVLDLVGAMEVIAPTRFAADWDNVGLLVGDPSAAALQFQRDLAPYAFCGTGD